MKPVYRKSVSDTPENSPQVFCQLGRMVAQNCHVESQIGRRKIQVWSDWNKACTPSLNNDSNRVSITLAPKHTHVYKLNTTCRVEQFFFFWKSTQIAMDKFCWIRFFIKSFFFWGLFVEVWLFFVCVLSKPWNNFNVFF